MTLDNYTLPRPLSHLATQLSVEVGVMQRESRQQAAQLTQLQEDVLLIGDQHDNRQLLLTSVNQQLTQLTQVLSHAISHSER